MVSVIVPVYNGEKYLRECIESVLNQTYQDVQLVLVDDKSPDNSIVIEREYAQAYPNRVKLIELEENKGIGNALNTGVDAADGEYFMVYGDDDWLDLDLCEKAMRVAEENDSDLVCVPKKGWIRGKSVLYRTMPEWCLGDMTLEKRRAAIVHLANDAAFVYIGAIKKEFFVQNDLRYLDIIPDDIPLHPLYFAYAKHIGMIEGSYYNYRIHDASMAHQKNGELYLNIHKAAVLMRERFMERNLYGELKEEVDFCFILAGYYYTIFNCLARYDNPPVELMHKVRDLVHEMVPEYAENYYIPLFWDRWKLELLLANDKSPEKLVEQFPDCDAFLDMSHDGALKGIFGEWEFDKYISGEHKEQVQKMVQYLSLQEKGSYFLWKSPTESPLCQKILEMLPLPEIDGGAEQNRNLVVFSKNDKVGQYAEEKNCKVVELLPYLKSGMEPEVYLKAAGIRKEP